jgi:murein DD-endopeptidase MepM/ murein hydrolase activator NlpD
MQFLPSTWKTWGVDGNRDHKRDPYNPVDAIFSAARYLKAAGAQTDLRKAIFAYNHASWYVDSVMLRSRVLAGYPADFVGALTGMTEARFPVAARSRYQDAADAPGKKKIRTGQNAADVVAGNATRRSIDIFARQGAPVVAVNDGVVRKIGFSASKGHYLVLQDVYGNSYTYSQLGSVQQVYPVPKPQTKPSPTTVQAISAHSQPKDPAPTAPASAGTQKPGTPSASPAPRRQRTAARPATRSAAPVAYKARLFANPSRPRARSAGGLEQLFDSKTAGKGFTTFDSYFEDGVIGLNAHNARLRPLKAGSKVIGGTILGRIGSATQQKASHVHFEVRPAGKGAPEIDPKPILDGWRLLASTNIYGASGKDALYGNTDSFTIGQVLLLPKPLLEQRVLSDPRIQIYACGRNDIRTGQVDRRVLATLEFLADTGLDPTVTSLKCGHSFMTASGNVSEHSSGDAVDIGAVNGTPILGHQGQGSITETTVKRLMQLQGTMAPHQIISLMDFGANTLALPDHYNHIHVGFRPLFGDNAKLGRQTASILKPGQWDALVQHLGLISNPVVPTTPSKYALPVRGHGVGE